MVCTPPIESIHACCALTERARSRVVRIHVRGTSTGMSRREAHSAGMREESAQSRSRVACRRARDTPFKNTNLAIALGISSGAPFLARRRAIGPIGPASVSTIAEPSGGTNAAANTISRTRAPHRVS